MAVNGFFIATMDLVSFIARLRNIILRVIKGGEMKKIENNFFILFIVFFLGSQVSYAEEIKFGCYFKPSQLTIEDSGAFEASKFFADEFSNNKTIFIRV